MIRVGIVGASGYTARETVRCLLGHPEAEVVAAVSRSGEGSNLCDLHPSLTGCGQVLVEDLPPAQLAQRCDVVLSCLPHGASAFYVAELLAAGTRVVDLSADYRLSSPELYLRNYGEPHPDAGRLGETPYGLPELFQADTRQEPLVANPGCYPTSALLPLGPLLKNGLVEHQGIVVDSKSGVSGAGRSAKLASLFCECNESLSAYSIGNHRHQPEIVDVLHRYTGQTPELVFTPHLAPMDRGILSTIYVRPRDGTTANQARECLMAHYDHQPFVHVLGQLPTTKQVSHTNFCHIAIRESGGWLIAISVIDNLIKGASGAAVQNLNRMFGLPEAMGLLPTHLR
jgi:N-acetyl-gamma-glutamyl-phosphate reductase